jgi:hypothetical protein
VPSDSGREVYLLQGNFLKTPSGQTDYQHKGLYPHPLKAQKVFIVFRLRGMVDAGTVASAYRGLVRQWSEHQVVIAGLQLDYDAPSRGLPGYAAFVDKVRSGLSKGTFLSVTGLADWVVSAPKQDLKILARSCDEIVFQLYHERHPVPYPERYFKALAAFPEPFKIGLLETDIGNETRAGRLTDNPSYRGIIHFRQM